MRKTTFLLVVALAVAFLGLALVAYGLPKDKQAAGSTAAPAEKAGVQKPLIRPDVIDYDDMTNMNAPAPAGRQAAPGIGAQRPLYPIPGVPYVNVRRGHPETAGGNNHMRRQVKASGSGVIHMVYRVFDSDSLGDTVRAPADSNTNGFFFYNAYDCGGSNSLLSSYAGANGKSYDLVRPPDPPETRVIRIQGGGIFVKSNNRPTIYGQRFIHRTDLFTSGAYSGRGWGTTNGAAECTPSFSMDTSYNAFAAPAAVAPVMRNLDDNVWVATFRNGGFPEEIAFSYTTDAGLSWSARVVLGTNSPWFNSTEIASNGNTFYIVSMADPADPTAFQTTERPVYLKGTYSAGTVTFGTQQDIAGNFELPGFLGNMLDIAATMVADTLVVAWNDWNNWLGNGFPGPGGHVHSALVFPDGSVETHKIANIDIDGRLPKMTTTAFGFGVDPWAQIELSYDPVAGNLYCIWNQPPPDSTAGAPNFQWADYEATGSLATHDLFISASPNRGRAWDNPRNITKSNNPGCTGAFGNECANEWWFSTDDRVSNDTIWTLALVNAYPGVQESAEFQIPPDVGPFTRGRDLVRLYKTEALEPVASVRADMNSLPTDTLKLFSMKLNPGGAPFTADIRLENIGLLDYFLDSIKFDPTFNPSTVPPGSDLHTTTNAVPGTVVNVGGFYDFEVTFDPSDISLAEQGLHSGLMKAYLRSTTGPSSPGSPAAEQTALGVNLSLYVVQTLCVNRKVRIYSGSNSTDVGSQGSIKDQSGEGMLYAIDGSDRFYDGGVWIYRSNLSAAAGVPGVPRKVTRQIFSDKFLRCVNDIVLDSTAVGSHHNLYAVSVATDVEDSTLIYKNIWEQSTHADSSDFLLQTTKLWNIGGYPIPDMSMGVLYDVDMQGGGSAAGENVGGDTVAIWDRDGVGGAAADTFFLGWIAGNDVTIDTCSPNDAYYGFVVVPGSVGSGGSFIRPRGAVVYEQSGFSYGIGNGTASGGDSLCQRWSRNLNVLTSTRDRQHDTLTGVWQDTAGTPPYLVCGGVTNPGTYRQTGPPYRADMGYMTIAKRVTNYPPNAPLSALAARYGLEGMAASLAAGVDSSFHGSESYTVIHVGSVSGLTDLIDHAVKGIDWAYKHRDFQTGPKQASDDTLTQTYYGGAKGDIDHNGLMNPADIAGALAIIFNGVTTINSRLIHPCIADVDGNGVVAPADFAKVQQGVFTCGSAGNPTAPCSFCPRCLERCAIAGH